MNYFNLVKNIQDTALKHQFVQEFFEGDVYDIMNTKDRKYPTVILTTERIDDTNGYQTITASLFCIDRLTSDGVNKLEVQSICQTILQGILLKLESTYPEMTIQTESFVPFTEKFKDLCAGMYVECSLSYPSIICDDEVFTTKEIILKSNGIYDVIGYDRAIVSVETPTQSKELSISANGSYTVLPDEGYYLDELQLDIDVTLEPSDIFQSLYLSVQTPEIPTIGYLAMGGTTDLYLYGKIEVLNTPANVLQKLKTLSRMSNISPTLRYVEFGENNLIVLTSLSATFSDCSNITYIKFNKNNLQNITNLSNTFAGCENVESISFPENSLKNVKTLYYTFASCNKLTSLIFPEGSINQVINANHFFGGCSSLTSLTFPEGALTQVTNMSGAFEGCRSLTSISFPEGSLTNVKTIRSGFDFCYSLTEVIFPNGALTQTTVIDRLFYDCRNLERVYIQPGALSNLIEMYAAFRNCFNISEVIFYDGDLTNVEEMTSAFYDCENLQRLVFPQGALTQVTSANYVFGLRNSLTNLEIYNLPDKDLDTFGFANCTALTLQSLQNILNALPVTTSSYRRCTIGTTNLNKLSAADIQIATDKGWALA